MSQNLLTNADFNNAVDLTKPNQEMRQFITIELVRYETEGTEDEDGLPLLFVRDTISIDVPAHVWYSHKRFQDIQPQPNEIVHWDKAVILWSSDPFPVRTKRNGRVQLVQP